MGYGFPAAIGAKIAKPECEVVCFTGDGSFQMNLQELAVCLQYSVPVKVIIINNRSLGMVKQWQMMFYNGRQSESYMDAVPDFVKLAESYGQVGLRVENEAQLEEFLNNATERVRTSENVDLLSDLNKLFKKNVPLTLRKYVIAYLLKEALKHYRPFNNRRDRFERNEQIEKNEVRY